MKNNISDFERKHVVNIVAILVFSLLTTSLDAKEDSPIELALDRQEQLLHKNDFANWEEDYVILSDQFPNSAQPMSALLSEDEGYATQETTPEVKEMAFETSSIYVAPKEDNHQAAEPEMDSIKQPLLVKNTAQQESFAENQSEPERKALPTQQKLEETRLDINTPAMQLAQLKNKAMASREPTLKETKAMAVMSGEHNVIKNQDAYVLKSLEIIDMDILDVLKLISKKSGLNIVAGQSVTGRVTTFLDDTNVFDALHIILSSNNLAYAQERGVIRVMTGPEYEKLYGKKFGVELTAQMFPLLGVKASRVKELVQGMLTQEGKVVADDISNTIFVEDNPQNLLQIFQFIQSIDNSVETRVFKLDYAKAMEISENIATKLTPDVGEVMIDERSNALVVKDFEYNLLKLEPLIDQLDQKEREVLIEAKIIQIILQDDYSMGVDWETLHSGFYDTAFNNSFQVLGGASSSTNNRGSVSVGNLSRDGFTAFLEALQTMGRTRVLSNPRISAVNNKEAKILVGTTKPYITSTTTTTTSGPTVSEEVNFIDVGVKLFVTPTIHSDDFITMVIRPEVSTAATSIITATENEIPIVDTSEVETTIRVKDQQTVILGGLIKEETSLTENQVPVLGSIPIVGRAFSSKQNESSKTEIVILLTPRIINGESQAEIERVIDDMEKAPIDDVTVRHQYQRRSEW